VPGSATQEAKTEQEADKPPINMFEAAQMGNEAMILKFIGSSSSIIEARDSTVRHTAWLVARLKS
jgi:hypothetical protein